MAFLMRIGKRIGVRARRGVVARAMNLDIVVRVCGSHPSAVQTLQGPSRGDSEPKVFRADPTVPDRLRRGNNTNPVDRPGAILGEMTGGHEQSGIRTRSPGTRIAVVAVVIGVPVLLLAAVPAVLYLRADHGRFADAPDPCGLLAGQTDSLIPSPARFEPSLMWSSSTKECRASGDVEPGVSPELSLYVSVWRTPFGDGPRSSSAGLNAMAGTDSVARPGLGDEAYSTPGLGWLSLRVSNMTIRLTTNVDLLLSQPRDALLAHLEEIARAVLERLPA